MKKLIFIIFVLVAGISAFLYFSKGKKDVKENGEERLFKVGRRDISFIISSNGTVKPRNRLEIKPPVSGRIEKILVREGSRVKKGQILAWMSSEERALLMDIARAKGELEKWKDTYRPAPIIAPLDGFIIKKNVEPGQSVSSQETILVMADKLIIQAQVDETDIGYLKKGMKAKITLDAYPENFFLGEIEHIAYESEIINNVTIYLVDILPLQKIKILRSGMSATVDFVVFDKKNVLAIPEEFLVRKGNRGYVFLKIGSEEKRVKVKTGIEDGFYIEVVEGLKEGDLIIKKKAPKRNFKRMFGFPMKKR
ncbi:MAG: efflux RND transporter periplasmic adaptor subunit [Elusimicrobia bacterium]|nr:efflux RND transporter periplasmic adaptor subunit [Elusimicrobiota bacterium]